MLEFALLISVCAAFGLAMRVLVGEKLSVPTCAFGVGLLLFAADAVFAVLSFMAVRVDDVLRWCWWRFVVMAFVPGVWLSFAVTYARGNYKVFARRWRPVIVIFFVAVPAAAFFFHDALLRPTEAGLRLALPGRLIHVAVVLGATAVLMNIERTFRTSVGVMRWQSKFMVIGIAALFLTRIYTSTQMLVFSGFVPALEAFNAAALTICSVLGFASVKRTKGFMLDLYPSPTLVYRSFAVLLVGGYLVAVGFFSKVIAYFGGSRAFPAEAFLLLVALVGLCLMLVSDRVRLITRRFVARYLRRPLYDVRKVWTTFSEATAGHAEEKKLSRATVKWIAETFDALSVTMWLRTFSGRALEFGASTSLSETEAEGIAHDEKSFDALEKVRQHGSAMNIDAPQESWAEALRGLQPSRFPSGGQRICVPVLNGADLIAVILLGDRVAGIPFSEEELDLLKCVSHQVSGDIMRIRLAERLGETKEMQAFQTMATFFVHDLKNTAWTLSLLMDNLKQHFDDPSFREEALRAVTKSVARINDVIGRISSLRHQLELKRETVDITDLIEGALKEFDGMTDVRLIKSLGEVPEIEADREQMHKVLVNLVLNAKEACAAGGEIRVTSERSNGRVTISVEDNGTGMSAQFQKERLFKPFQTTKKKGIGIGMFQSKTIVEAHNGTITVKSHEGRGTRVEVMLPAKGGAV